MAVLLQSIATGDVSKVVPIDKMSVVITIVLAFVFLRSLKIDNITSPATVVAPDEDFKVGFDIVNEGTKELSDLKVSVTAENGIICKSQSITVVDSLKVGEKKSFEFFSLP